MCKIFFCCCILCGLSVEGMKTPGERRTGDASAAQRTVICITNMPRNWDAYEVEAKMNAALGAGSVGNVRMPVNKVGKPAGIAFVELSSHPDLPPDKLVDLCTGEFAKGTDQTPVLTVMNPVNPSDKTDDYYSMIYTRYGDESEETRRWRVPLRWQDTADRREPSPRLVRSRSGERLTYPFREKRDDDVRRRDP